MDRIVLSACLFDFSISAVSGVSLDDLTPGFCFVIDALGTDPWHGYVFALTLKRGSNFVQYVSQTYYQETCVRYKEGGVWSNWKKFDN